MDRRPAILLASERCQTGSSRHHNSCFLEVIMPIKTDISRDCALDRRNILLGGATLAVGSAIDSFTPLHATQVQPPAQSIAPSSGWLQALPPAPDVRTKVTEEYARHVARDGYFWAWPLVNMYNRRLAFQQVKDFIFAGPVPSAPLNKLAMLTDYITPEQRGLWGSTFRRS
jgi:hypothetical protein